MNRTVDLCLLCLLLGWCCNLNLDNCCPLRRDALKMVKHLFHYSCQTLISCCETASFKASSLTIWKGGQNTIKQRPTRWVALYFQPISWRKPFLLRFTDKALSAHILRIYFKWILTLKIQIQTRSYFSYFISTVVIKKEDKYQTRYLKNTWPAVLQSHQWCKMHVVIAKHNWVSVAFFRWP